MTKPQEQPSSGAREVQTVVTTTVNPGDIFELHPGGKPALYRGLSAAVGTVGAPKRIAVSVDFTVDIDCPTGALAIGDLVDYDIATQAAVANGAGDFTLGRVVIGKAAGVLRCTVDTSERTEAVT